MSTTLKHEPQKDMERHQRDALHTLIGEQVMHTLGEPADLHQVQVRRLWDDHFRVNVLIGRNITSIKVANSYFVKADGEGNIVESSPKIAKLY